MARTMKADGWRKIEPGAWVRGNELKVSLPAGLNRRLRRYAKKVHKTPDEILGEALREYRAPRKRAGRKAAAA